MQFTETNRNSWLEPYRPSGVAKLNKGWKLKLSLEVSNHGDVVIVHCHGRIVYREEATALSQLVGEILEQGTKVVLDLSGVHSIDSAGIGELVFLHSRAQSRSADLKCAGPGPRVRQLLDLTNVCSVIEIHPTLGEAVAAFMPEEVCADC
jgi:anti-anti-sigma factor